MAGRLTAMEVYQHTLDAAFGKKIPMASGQYRTCLDRSGPKMVKLLTVVGVTAFEDVDGPADWRIQDMATGNTAVVRAPNLSSRIYNELEVLAWMAK